MKNHTDLPKIWLMTDARNDHMLESVIRKMPRRSGIIFRHYHLDMESRCRRFAEIQKLAHRRNHLILLAGPPALARKWKADGVHGRQWKRRETNGLVHSAAAHDRAEIGQAKGNGAELIFLSPLFATRSHPDVRPLALSQVRRLMDLVSGKIILLGGMDAKRYRRHGHLRAHGWAAIDGLM
ncbi:hypothetical protein MNBD_ALPHA04-1501 [hydrothermal vent metagenome]|uniref:Thiamine phosphate synthase/TenI domain-containing protein n=1 Tax=hydrothermal vent metagenome TaxID=652676 RepID=A0A3B0T6G2_9ZZZZ